jgi:NAD(P)-dependent dehydrogenase (short-subunit alcohol dehydrogenase family)
MRAQGHGRIINCSSVLGLVGMKWRGAYVSTKFAMEGLTDVLRIEMKGTGIDVILIEPGPIATKHPRKRRPAFRKMDRLGKLGPGDQYAALRAGSTTRPDPRRIL